jgi:hypothetical protein
MRSFNRLAPVLLLVLASTLSACGGDSDNTSDDAAPPPSSSPSEPPTSGPTSADTSATTGSEPATETSSSATASSEAALSGACEVVTPEDVQAAYGVEFGDGEIGGGGTSEGGVDWQSDNCDWEATDLVEVQLAISGPDDFEGGFTCPEPSGTGDTVTSVSPPGPQAAGSWWIVEDKQPLEATLRVCTRAYLVEIGLEFEDGTDFKGDPQAQTIELATQVLQNLS